MSVAGESAGFVWEGVAVGIEVDGPMGSGAGVVLGEEGLAAEAAENLAVVCC